MVKIKSMKWIASISIVLLLAVGIGIAVHAETSTTTAGQTCPDGTTVPAGSVCPTTSPASPETTCSTGGGKWCKNSDGATGWCSYSSSPCPAYDSASCSSQGGEWCAYQSGTGGWCATGGSSCPINDQATCVSKGRNWCAGTSGGMGWCATTGTTCPANDSATCATQGGEWCTSSYGGSGWCSTTIGSCPINDQATCVSKGRSWCASATFSGTGWCATTGSTCPNTTPVATSTTSTTYTCSDGSKVSDSTMCPRVNTMTWPNTESDCKKYKGVWCASSGSAYSSYSNSYNSYVYTGSCMMAGSTCPVQTPANMYRCWDDTTVSSYSSCPSTPMNSSDCTAKGGNWCESSGSSWSSGWCNSKSNPCSKMPPAGKMTCPDNQTFVTSISECPTASVVEQKQTKTCSNGTIVSIDATCPIAYITCADGQKVPEGAECPKKIEDGISTCINKGGTWCLENGKGGYCSMNGCQIIPIATTTDVKKDILNEKQIKSINQQKKTLIKKIELLEGDFKRLDDQESLVQVRALKEKLLAAAMDSSIFDVMDSIRDDVSTLQEVRSDLQEQGRGILSERDQNMQKRALSQFKKEINSFASHISKIKSRIAKLEKGGFVIPASVKESVNKGEDLAKTIKNASSFDEARDAGEALADISDELNEWLPKIEQLTRLQGLLAKIDKEIKNREREIKKIEKTAKKVNVTEQMADINADIKEVKDAFAQIKKKDFTDEDPFDYIEVVIFDKLDDIDNEIETIKMLSSYAVSLKKMEAQANKYEAKIKKLNKKQNITEMQESLADVKDHISNMRKIKLNKDNAGDVADEMSATMDLLDALGESLQLIAPSSLEKEMFRKLDSKESIQKIDTPELERDIARAHRVATLYRQAPAQGYYSILDNRKVKTRNFLAKD